MIQYFTWSRAEKLFGQDFKKNMVGIYVAVAGNVTAVELSGHTVVYTTMPVGFYPMVGLKEITGAPPNTLVLYA